jgi:hypothetical protein
MKRNRFLILLASLPVVLFSCYQDIDMEKYRPEPDCSQRDTVGRYCCHAQYQPDKVLRRYRQL